MATSAKDIYAGNVYAANIYAAGVFRGIGVTVTPITTTNICFTDEYLSVSRMVDETLACTRMIDESLEVCASHPPALAMTLATTQWYFDQDVGDDGNTGLSAAQALQTWAKLNEMIADSVLVNDGRWVGEYYEDKALATVSSNGIADTWETDFGTGKNRLVDGDTIVILSDFRPVVGDSQINLRDLPGVKLRGAHGGVVVTNKVDDISDVAWTQHGTYTNVWYWSATGMEHTSIEEIGFLLLRANFLLLADALDYVNSGVGRMYATATTVYLRPRTGSTNPNTDGRERFAVIELSVDDADWPGIVVAKDGQISDITIQGGLLCEEEVDGLDAIAKQVMQPCLSLDTGGLLVLDNVTLLGGSGCTIQLHGETITGFLVVRNCTLGGTYSHANTNQVVSQILQTNTQSGTGTWRTIWRNFAQHADGSWHNDGAVQNDTLASGGFKGTTWFTTTADTALFAYGRFHNFTGHYIDPIGFADDAIRFSDSDLLMTTGLVRGMLVERSTFRSAIQRAEAGSTRRFSKCKIIARAVDGVSLPGFMGDGAELDLDFCTEDMRLFPYATVNAPTAKVSGTIALRRNNCVIIANDGQNNAALISGAGAVDDVSLDYCRLLNGSGTTRLLHLYDAANKTYSDADTLDIVNNSGAHASILLDAEYAPQAGSAVLGVADPANTETEDFDGVTGEVNRDDVGAREA